MTYFIIIGGLLGSFLHLILKDGIVKEGEIRAWQNWLIAAISGVVSLGAYLVAVKSGFLPAATDALTELGLGAFVGYTLDSLVKKVYHKKPNAKLKKPVKFK